MKWKNIDIGQSYYYITGTFTEWLPLFRNADVRSIVCEEITRALEECNGFLSAYVLMPDHVHLLVFLPDGKILHRFNKLWRGRSARRIIEYTENKDVRSVLDILAKHANGECQYAVWKEQVRALAIWNEKKLLAKVDYIHFNPVRRGLVMSPGEWQHSSLHFYETGAEADLDVRPLAL